MWLDTASPVSLFESSPRVGSYSRRGWGSSSHVLGAASPGSTCQVAQISRGAVRGYAIFERKRFGATPVTYFEGCS